jgi:hypothetical protein
MFTIGSDIFVMSREVAISAQFAKPACESSDWSLGVTPAATFAAATNVTG